MLWDFISFFFFTEIWPSVAWFSELTPVPHIFPSPSTVHLFWVSVSWLFSFMLKPFISQVQCLRPVILATQNAETVMGIQGQSTEKSLRILILTNKKTGHGCAGLSCQLYRKLNRIVVPSCPGINVRCYWKITKVKRAGGTAQVVERLPSKCKALNSNPSTPFPKKKLLSVNPWKSVNIEGRHVHTNRSFYTWWLTWLFHYEEAWRNLNITFNYLLGVVEHVCNSNYTKGRKIVIQD
jgi:hypothetical protein